MKQVFIQKCDDGVIWVTSDEDQNGIEVAPTSNESIEEQMLIALAKFFNYDSGKVLNL